MRFDSSDVRAGLSAGQRQVVDFGVPERVFADLFEKVERVLGTWPTDTSGRFIETFCEAAAIAEASRYYYEDQPLELSEIGAYLGASILFFNSWTHRDA